MRELSLHLLDLLQNSREAGAAAITIEVVEDLGHDRLMMRVTDDGRGVPEQSLDRVFDPFYTSRQTRDVGLGLPLLKAAAQRAGGDAQIESRPGRTEVRAWFAHSSIDRAPLGDVPGTLLAVLLDDSPPRLVYRHEVGDEAFEFDTQEAVEALDGATLADIRVQQWLRQYLERNIAALRVNLAQ